jgi:hypothetical protein
MLIKVERPWLTIRDSASAMMHRMSVPNSMWSCAVSTVVYLHDRTFSRAFISLSGGIPITLLVSNAPDASKFRVFGSTVYANVPDK